MELDSEIQQLKSNMYKKERRLQQIYCIDETLLKVNNQFVGIRLILTQLKEEFVVFVFLLK